MQKQRAVKRPTDVAGRQQNLSILRRLLLLLRPSRFCFWCCCRCAYSPQTELAIPFALSRCCRPTFVRREPLRAGVCRTGAMVRSPRDGGVRPSASRERPAMSLLGRSASRSRTAADVRSAAGRWIHFRLPRHLLVHAGKTMRCRIRNFIAVRSVDVYTCLHPYHRDVFRRCPARCTTRISAVFISISCSTFDRRQLLVRVSASRS
jgi:hypothetical protein